MVFWGCNFEAINILQTADLNKKDRKLYKFLESIYANR